MRRIAVISIAALAVAACVTPPAKPVPTAHNPPATAAVAARIGYSEAVRVGDWVLVSGQIGYDENGIPASFTRQAELAFGHLREALAAAGARLDQVVELTTYQTDMADFEQLVSVRRQVFGDSRPAWTAVGVTALVDPALKLEVQARAYAPLPDPVPRNKP